MSQEFGIIIYRERKKPFKIKQFFFIKIKRKQNIKKKKKRDKK